MDQTTGTALPASLLFSEEDSEDLLWNKMLAAAGAFGITSALYAFTHSRYTASRTGIAPSLFIRHSHPKDYTDIFPDGLSLEDDIAAELLMQGKGPLFWPDFPSLDLRESQKARYAQDVAHGMGTGVSFCFRFGGSSGIGGMCWAARYADPQQFRNTWHEKRPQMEALAHHFDRHMRPAVVRRIFALSPREREVLSYSAGGMTAKQIANHLNLQPKTVANTLERARRAMGAVSTMEAVAKAIVYELIS
jgi:LuxR family transcriptional regulator